MNYIYQLMPEIKKKKNCDLRESSKYTCTRLMVRVNN